MRENQKFKELDLHRCIAFNKTIPELKILFLEN